MPPEITMTRHHIPSGTTTTRILTTEDLLLEFHRNRHRFIGRESQSPPSAQLWGAWLANHWTQGDWYYTARLWEPGDTPSP